MKVYIAGKISLKPSLLWVLSGMILFIYIIYHKLDEYDRKYNPDGTKIDFSSEHVQFLVEKWQEDNNRRNSQNDSRVNRAPEVHELSTKAARQNKLQLDRRKRPNVTRKVFAPEEAALFVQPYMVSSSVENVDFNCTTLGALRPVTPICLYPRERDLYISEEIRNEGAWERHIVTKVQDLIKTNPEMGFIDLGANIGQYSLIMANMGHNVLAVEPFTENLRRFQMALKLGKLGGKIKILKNAISNERGVATLAVNPDNQGDARVQNEAMRHGSGRRCNNITTCERIKLILLEDIVPYLSFKSAILKIDIQGYEHKAFLYADNLFNEVYIPYIFMEWAMMRDHYVTIFHESEEKDEVLEMIAFLLERGYEVTSMVTGMKLNHEHWQGWPEDVLWTHSLSDFMA